MSERDKPRAFQVYKHFKGNYYLVLNIARHSETGEELVIYRPLFGEEKICARPLDMFMSEVDHEKYPDVRQKWRFALAKAPVKSGEVSMQSSEEEKATGEKKTAEEGKALEEDKAPDFLDEFLDADTYEDKLDVFTGMWKTLTEDNIDNVAIVMDLELKGETLEEKYKEILSCLKMRAKYETSRLR